MVDKVEEVEIIERVIRGYL